MVIALLDDDNIWLEKAREKIQIYAERNEVSLDLLCFNRGEDLLSYKGANEINAVFIDIVLEEENGIEVVSEINKLWPDCQIVYCTDYMYYAMDVYGTRYAFFLVKSQLEDRLDSMMRKIIQIFRIEKQEVSYHVVRGEMTRFRVKDIYYFERKTRMTTMVTRQGSYNIQEKKTEVARDLPEGEFTRCHSSFTVNLAYIVRKNGNSYEMINGESVPISKSFADITKKDYLRWGSEQM